MSLFDQNSSFFHRNKGRYYGNNQETFGFAAIIKREIEPKIISSNYHSMTNTLTKTLVKHKIDYLRQTIFAHDAFDIADYSRMLG